MPSMRLILEVLRGTYGYYGIKGCLIFIVYILILIHVKRDGAKAYGKIFIGDNSIVAPNTVVIKDVPPNSIVSGVPGRIIKTINQ